MRAVWILVSSIPFLFASEALAQTSIHTQEVGDFSYHTGTLQGQSLYGQSQRIGSFTYSNFNVGGTRPSRSFTTTTQRIGSFDYTTGSDGSSYTTQHIGDFSYTTGPSGTYTTQRIGNSLYTSGP